MTRDSHSLIVVEDHPVMRETLCSVLARHSDWEVLGSVASGEEALERIPIAAPDLVLVDISLPGMSGLELIAKLRADHPGIKCLVISAHNEAVYSQKARAVGARGFVPKDDVSCLVDAVRAVLDDGDYWRS